MLRPCLTKLPRGKTALDDAVARALPTGTIEFGSESQEYTIQSRARQFAVPTNEVREGVCKHRVAASS